MEVNSLPYKWVGMCSPMWDESACLLSDPLGSSEWWQFAKIALIITGKAAFEDDHMICMSKVLFRKIAHSLDTSLGSLASISDVLHISLWLMSFFPGALPCNVPVLTPSRISTTFSNAAFHQVVDNIATRTASLLEILIMLK
jgi:hypothetical protein